MRKEASAFSSSKEGGKQKRSKAKKVCLEYVARKGTEGGTKTLGVEGTRKESD